MELNALTAISPIDGRYRNQVKNLAPYYSEFGLIKYRIQVEIEYFIALAELPLPGLESFSKSLYPSLRNIYLNFTEKQAQEIKEIEKKTNHDVKAVEYFIKAAFDNLNIAQYSEFIHFGLTSQDINNTAIPMLLKDSVQEEILPLVYLLQNALIGIAKEWKGIAMLAKTHGQPASPTTLGKELMVFVERINNQLELLKNVPYSAKFGGATGNFNAHFSAYPEIDWIEFANEFLNTQLGLHRSQFTTQIEHYDNLAALFDNLKRINTILIDLDRDMWQYISMEYFKQKIKEGEIGSSAMPHKVNPIDFENSEGNLGIANAIFEHLSSKLPISRLQRDLTDSTVLRNIGVPIAHMYIAIKSLLKGLEKIELNKAAIDKDLENNWVVIAEGIQTILRRVGYPQPYEALKDLTRQNKKITREIFEAFIETLNVSPSVKAELKTLTPYTYTGVKFEY
ncbi:adenylosuccinate lyase [Sporocytophaga myxococcoides]|uniref:Adenylosuccinate lyase n=1 Tax=Sporocytophaga myxococcoides TaxID=153721 RepID=A0A098LGP6_9BACT|nr:adenylosuccinate lyase [Sporocytophaga myxococcoides]GAL86166.1 adenylosuccinate lyase [Sporocytophaga myxococcoides]